MLIWIFNHYAAPPYQPAGTRHHNLGRWLVEHGHDVTIFASGFGHGLLPEEQPPRAERTGTTRVDGVRFVWIRTPGYLRNDTRRLLNMLTYTVRVPFTQRRLPRPDVLIGSSVHLGAACAAWLVATLRRTTFVFEVRDLWPQTLIDMGALRGNGLPARLLRAVERFLYRRARLVISLLPGAVDYIERQGVSRDKVFYLPNGAADPGGPLPAQPSTPAACKLLQQLQTLREQGRVIAAYTGAHGAANRVDILVHAARVLHQRAADHIVFLLVGGGPEKDACVRLAREHRLDNVVFWPPVPNTDVPLVLALADITLFTLRDTPVFRYGLSSNKLFDYLASGRPTVFAAGVAENPIRTAGSGICVPPESPVAVADAVATLAALSRSERDTLGERGRRYVAANHSIEVLAGGLLAALEAVTAEPATAGGRHPRGGLTRIRTVKGGRGPAPE